MELEELIKQKLSEIVSSLGVEISKDSIVIEHSKVK